MARKVLGQAVRWVGRFRIDTGPWIEIVGVVGNTKHGSLRDRIDPEFYQPYGRRRGPS